MELVKSITTPVVLDYDYVTGRAQSRFLRGIAEGKILGQRCTECRRVLRAVARRLPALRGARPRKRCRSRTRARSPPSASCACRPRT